VGKDTFFFPKTGRHGTTGGGGGPDGRRCQGSGELGSAMRWGIERGEEGESQIRAHRGRDQRGWPDFGGGGRRWCIGGGRSPSTGGAPVLPSRRAGRRRPSSTSQRCWWRQSLRRDSTAGGWRTAGGGASRFRRTVWLGGDARHGELGHTGASAGAAI
jgi:hypothetical protein